MMAFNSDVVIIGTTHFMVTTHRHCSAADLFPGLTRVNSKKLASSYFYICVCAVNYFAYCLLSTRFVYPAGNISTWCEFCNWLSTFMCIFIRWYIFYCWELFYVFAQHTAAKMASNYFWPCVLTATNYNFTHLLEIIINKIFWTWS